MLEEFDELALIDEAGELFQYPQVLAASSAARALALAMNFLDVCHVLLARVRPDCGLNIEEERRSKESPVDQRFWGGSPGNRTLNLRIKSFFEFRFVYLRFRGETAPDLPIRPMVIHGRLWLFIVALRPS